MEGHAAHAAAMLDFLAGLHLLTAHDKRGVLKLVKGLDPSSYELIARSGHGISVFRTATCSNNRIYRVTGMGEVAADPQVQRYCSQDVPCVPCLATLLQCLPLLPRHQRQVACPSAGCALHVQCVPSYGCEG